MRDEIPGRLLPLLAGTAVSFCVTPQASFSDPRFPARAPSCAERVSRKKRKVIVVTFGGGARDQETFDPEGQENIPHLLTELAPQSSFFTHVSNQGILGHYVATASLTTGVYETLNNFSAVAPEHPTVFEYFRKDLKRRASDAWVVAPSNGFNRIGESDCRSYGPEPALPLSFLNIYSAPQRQAEPRTLIIFFATITKIRSTRPISAAASSSCSSSIPSSGSQ